MAANLGKLCLESMLSTFLHHPKRLPSGRAAGPGIEPLGIGVAPVRPVGESGAPAGHWQGTPAITDALAGLPGKELGEMVASNERPVAVVTGASSGIGWHLAKVLGEQGYRVGLVARRRDKLEQLAAEMAGAGTSASVAVADVGDRSDALQAFALLREQLGPVDLLIANAGVGAPTLLDPVNVADVETMFRVNVLGMVYAVEAVLPDMLRRGSGHIAGVSSLGAYKGLPGESGYCASKAAMNTYLEGLRIQLRDRGVRVTTVCPGFVRTAMTEINQFHMPMLMEPEDAAQRIVRAIRRGRKVYNFPWPLMWLMRMTRWLPDWVVARTMSDYNAAPPMPPGGI
jgi:short-subunit dehydrogenase